MLQNAYFLAKIGADAAENEQHFAEISPIGRARRQPRRRRRPALLLLSKERTARPAATPPRISGKTRNEEGTAHLCKIAVAE